MGIYTQGGYSRGYLLKIVWIGGKAQNISEGLITLDLTLVVFLKFNESEFLL